MSSGSLVAADRECIARPRHRRTAEIECFSVVSHTTLTQFGSNSSSTERIGVASVAIGASISASADATARMPLAGASGSSPWRFTTIVSSGQPHSAAHSASRSLPDA